MNEPQYFMVFDVESIGLHGEGFAVGWVVVGPKGAKYEEGICACPPNTAAGSEESREWCAKNIPELPVTHSTPRAIRDAFWAVWKLWKASGAVLVADCCWPVEARFLAQCVDDEPSRLWEGPYPLHDLASVMLAKGKNPLENNERIHGEAPAHNPLNDARQSARLLIEQLVSQSAPQPVPAPSVSAEATLAAETITHLFGVGHVNDIDFTIQRAIDAATETLRELLDEQTADWRKVSAELALLHESHDALAREVEGLRADKERLETALKIAFLFIDYATYEDGKGVREVGIVEGVNLLDGHGPITAQQLDEARAAMTAQKGRDAL